MNTHETGKCPPDEDSGQPPEQKVLPAKEAVRRDLRSLEVRADSTVMFSPHEREFADYFAKVEVKNFDDLRTLGLVPRGLAEEKVRQAIAADDEESYKIAHTTRASQPAKGCGCGCGCGCEHQQQGTGGVPVYNDLRQLYASTRRSFNPALSRVLSEHLQTRVEWDSPVASVVRNWTRYVDVGVAVISVAILNDITIDRGATLHVDPSTKSLLAGTIWIHRTGKLVYSGGYLKVWAHAIKNLTNVSITVTALGDIPWFVHAT